MFNDMIVSCQPTKTNKGWAMAVSALTQSALLGILILIPLLYSEALPSGVLSLFLVAPVPPSPTVSSLGKKTPRGRNVLLRQGLATPPKIPSRMYDGPDREQTLYNNPYSGDSSETSNLLTTIIGSVPASPAPPAVATLTTKRIRLGGLVEEALLVTKVVPEYPTIAKVARVSGKVELHAVIGTDGTIRELEYISGPPLLISATLNAVKQWRYQPTLLNGLPVEVETTIDVIFRLSD